MTATSGDALSIESVDVFARQLYRRTRDAGTDFVDLAIAVCSLHRALKHLDAEAQDPDSPLYSVNPASGQSRDSVYARQLRSLVEDSEFSLKQVDTVLQRYGESTGRRDLDSAERARKIGLIRGDVVSQTMKIEVFLDTIQLHNPAKAQRTLEDVDDQQLDVIKDKVDAIASRLFHERRDQSPIDADEDELWRSFKAQLEREGFSSEVLRKNKEVLRAYIRELECHQRHGDGTPPSVRGLLEWDAHPRTVTDTGSYPTHSRQANPRSETNPIGMEGRRRTEVRGMTDSLAVSPQPRASAVPTLPSRLSFEPYTSSEASDSEGNPSSHMALISTRDLMALDRYSADKVAAAKGASLLSPSFSHLSISPGTSPSQRYLPSGIQPLHIPASALSSSFSPISPPPPYGTSPNTLGAGWDPPALPSSAPLVGNDMLQQYQPSPRRSSHLAPDSKGQTIPLDATWTKIDRKLVSPEVLEEAGVRYEARPNFVAVLGVLSREKIEEYARRSFEVRKARRAPTTTRPANTESRAGDGRPRHQETYGDRGGRGTGTRELERDNTSEALFDASDSDSPDDDEHNNRRRGLGRSSRGRYTPKDYAPTPNKKSKHLDSDEEEKGTKVYPVIVSPPASVNGEEKNLSPSSTVAPKPILKNKNPNHVRFDRSGPREISAEEVSRRDRDRDNNTRRGGDRERERDRDRLARDRDRDRSKRAKSRDRSRERDRVRDADRNRDRDRERERDQRGGGRGEEERPARRSVLKEATTAIGVSSAAATLLSVLTHAAHHL